jgi:hypothetical protein
MRRDHDVGRWLRLAARDGLVHRLAVTCPVRGHAGNLAPDLPERRRHSAGAARAPSPVSTQATISPVPASAATWSLRQDRRARPRFSPPHSPWPIGFGPELSAA